MGRKRRASAANATCPSCGAALPERHCPECGELRADLRHHTIKDFLEHAFESLTHVDGRIVKTLRLLFTKPGRLTAEYMRGARKPYMAPFPLFLIVNLTFFVGQAVTGQRMFSTPLDVHVSDAWSMPYQPVARRMLDDRLREHGWALDPFRQRFDAAARPLSKSMPFLMVPFFALALGLVGPWRRPALERLVFGLHVMSAALCVALVFFPVAYPLAARLGPSLSAQSLDAVVSGTFGLLLLVYLYRGLRVIHPQPALAAVLRAAILVYAIVLSLQMARFILFLILIYTVKIPS